jgi:membrane protein YqaA with SNARE-associated domain
MEAYLGLFFGALLASTILPISSEAGFVGLLALERYDPGTLFLVAFAGNTLGSAISWQIGRAHV